MIAREITEREPVLSVKNLVVRFQSRDGRHLTAVNQVSLDITKGEALGLVGETGCGKSTLARAALKLVPIHAGTVRLLGHDVTKLNGTDLRSMRRHTNMIFQDPLGSLNPRKTVGKIIGEPLKIHRIGTSAERAESVRTMMELVGLPRELINRNPVQLSGGQQQRVGIARALITRPAIVICDEPVSALDASTRAQILSLLVELREMFNLSFLFIAHDLAVVRQLCDRVAVMYLGRLVEEGSTERIFSEPRHPYTQALIAAILRADGNAREQLSLVPELASGDPPSPLKPPSGCAYQPRCPYAIQDPCRKVSPPFELISGVESGAVHLVACHRWMEVPQRVRR